MRLVSAVALGMLGALFIWAATPYVDIIINSNNYAADLSDGYLPPGAMFVILVTVVLLNPLLYLIKPKWALNIRQLAIIFGITLVASSLAGDGLLRRLPYSIAGAPRQANPSPRYSRIYKEHIKPPQALFADELGFEKPTPAGDYFVEELPPLDPSKPGGAKQPLPWKAWLMPAIAWGSLLVSAWIMMVAMAQIVLPQWRKNERLAFPMLEIQRSLIQEPHPGKRFGPLFHNKAFWGAVIIVFVLRCLVKMDMYFPGKVPYIPLSWNLSAYFTELPYLHLPGYIKSSMIFFTVIGVAYFMPTRINFSVWFFMLAYGIYEMACKAWFPPFYGGAVNSHRTGAMVGIAMTILYLGRAHWKYVFGLIFKKAETEEEINYRRAALMFLVGVLGMLAWLLWVGMGLGWAMLLVAFAFMISLLITRVIAEAGLPFVTLMAWPDQFIWLFPASIVSPHVLFYQSIFTTLFSSASLASPAAMATQAMVLDEEATPSHRWKFGWILVAVLVIGFVVCGAIHMHGNYNNSVTIDGLQTPLNPYFFNTLNGPLGTIENITKGQAPISTFSRSGHLLFGASLAGVLEWASLSIPTWPIHPIGMICMRSWWAGRTWVCIFFVWALKLLILRYGGSKLYRILAPTFLGLVVGEVAALILWGLLPGAILVTKAMLL